MLGHLLSRKEILRASSGNKKGTGTVKACYGKEYEFSLLSYPLTNFEIQKYYQNKPIFNGFFFRR